MTKMLSPPASAWENSKIIDESREQGTYEDSKSSSEQDPNYGAVTPLPSKWPTARTLWRSEQTPGTRRSCEILPVLHPNCPLVVTAKNTDLLGQL